MSRKSFLPVKVIEASLTPMDSGAGSSVARRRRCLSVVLLSFVSLPFHVTLFLHEFLVGLGFLSLFTVANCWKCCWCCNLILWLLLSPSPSLLTVLVPDLLRKTSTSPISYSQISDLKLMRRVLPSSSLTTMTFLPSGKIDANWLCCAYGSCTSNSTNSGYCSYLLSWTDSSGQWFKYDCSKNLWLRRGNVVDRSLCLAPALASSSNLVKLIYLNAGAKVVRPSLLGLKHPSLATIAIHTQQLLNLIYSLVPSSHLSNVVMDSKMEFSSKKNLGKDGLFYPFGAVSGVLPPMSSKILHRSENPTSANARQIQSIAWSLSMLEDCSPLALIEKATQTSSCRGHERSFHSFLLAVEMNLSITTPLHKRYFSFGSKAKEYCLIPSRLLSCVMVRLGPEDTTRLIPMRLEVQELSTSRYTVTISKSEAKCAVFSP